MAITSIGSRTVPQYLPPVFSCCCATSAPVHKANQLSISRRAGAIAITASVFIATEAMLSDKPANGFDFRMTVPDQTVEEAQSLIRDHAQALLDIKSLIESEEWREAQRELRTNSALLKQDIYTLIQGKEGSVRPLLRKLYFDLFTNVTKLDYAARDQDAIRVRECYDNIAATLDSILSRI